jgi:hypothetical protein
MSPVKINQIDSCVRTLEMIRGSFKRVTWHGREKRTPKRKNWLAHLKKLRWVIILGRILICLLSKKCTSAGTISLLDSLINRIQSAVHWCIHGLNATWNPSLRYSYARPMGSFVISLFNLGQSRIIFFFFFFFFFFFSLPPVENRPSSFQ